jgi:hypothetical protein
MNCITGDAFTNPSNPLALRAVVASSDHSPRQIQEEAALHQHRNPSETTGTEHYRRMRNPDRSQIPSGLYIHQNGSKVPAPSHRAIDTSTFRQNIRETRSRPPGTQSYHPGARHDPGGAPGGGMYRMDNTGVQYPGERNMDRQQQQHQHRPPTPPFAGRAPPHSHSHVQYSQGMHGAPVEMHAGHPHLQYSQHGNTVHGPPVETHARFPIQQREQERFPMQQREQERLASLPVEEFDVFFPNGVPNEPSLGVDYPTHGTRNQGYEVQGEQYPNEYDLLTHAVPPEHHQQYGDPRGSHIDTDWDANPGSLQSGHAGYAQEGFQGMGFRNRNNAAATHTGYSQQPMGLAERFAARAGVHLTPQDQHTLPLNPQLFYEPQSFETRKRKPADIFLERRQSAGYSGQNQVEEGQGQQVDPFAEEFRALPAVADHGYRGPNPVSDGGIDRFRTQGGASGQVERRSPLGIARFQQRGTSQQPGETPGTDSIAMCPTWKGPAENSQQNMESCGENTKNRIQENDWQEPPVVQPFRNNTQLLNSAQPADGALRRQQESVSNPYLAQSVRGTSKPTHMKVMTDQQNLRPSSPRLQPAEIVRRNYQPVDRQPLVSKAEKENVIDLEEALDPGDQPQHFPAALHPTYDTPSYLRFFNESIEVTLKGDRSRRPGSPIKAAADHATQESDTLEDVDFEGKTSIWGAFVRQKKQA